MKVHSNFAGQPSKKRLLAFSCATALASFAIIARPAFAYVRSLYPTSSQTFPECRNHY